MATTSKPRVIKDFEKLPKSIKELIIATYPQGFTEKLIHYPNKDGMLVSALPFETEDTNYLVRFSNDDVAIVYDDSEFDDEVKAADIEGKKMKAIKDIDAEDNEDEFEEKYSDDVAIGPGIEDDGEDDDDDEEELPFDEDDFDDDDYEDDFEEEIIVVEKQKPAKKTTCKTAKKK